MAIVLPFDDLEIDLLHAAFVDDFWCLLLLLLNDDLSSV